MCDFPLVREPDTQAIKKIPSRFIPLNG
jgi:hypothetical protein